jgi:hypothetical protein
VALNRWDWQSTDDREQFAGEPFVSIDPGADGYAMGWESCYRAPPVGYCHALHPDSIVELMRRIGARVVVVESQYVTSLKNARHILELTFRLGIALGWVGCAVHLRSHVRLPPSSVSLDLFEVATSTWQAHQRRQAGIKGRKKRGEGIQVTLDRAVQVIGTEDEWRSANAKQKEGMASALGIGEWWKSLFDSVPARGHKPGVDGVSLSLLQPRGSRAAEPDAVIWPDRVSKSRPCS